MGNYRFKLSDMMPNAWFYKLRDMNNKNPTKKKLPPSSTQKPRKSFYHTTESIRENQFHGSSKNLKAFDAYFPLDLPRKSSKNRTRRKSIYKPSPKKTTPSFSAICICREPENPVWLKPGHLHDHFESPVDFHTSPAHDFLDTPSSEFGCSDSFYVSHESLNKENKSWSNSCLRSSANDIIFDMDKTSYNTTKAKMSAESKLIAELGLRPILTKPAKRNHEVEYPNFKNSSEKKIQSKKSARTFSSSPATRKSVSRSRGVKVNKITSKNNETRGRKSVNGENKGMFYTDSFAIVKASLDPEQDFRDSMMEMIVEKNIKASKDLEDLLACYLSLNSNQYHDLIINAFEQIWFDMPKL